MRRSCPIRRVGDEGSSGVAALGRAVDDAGEPGANRGRHRLEIRPQAVVTGYLDHRSPRGGGRDPEPISAALHDERRDMHGVELREPARCLRAGPAARRLEREREAEHGDGSRRLCSAAGNPGTERAAANDARKPAELAGRELLHDRSPGGVELARGCRRAPPGDPVRLFDERNRDSLRDRDVTPPAAPWPRTSAARGSPAAWT
jgi:hypothetical protein